MLLDGLRSLVSRRPVWVAGAWLAATIAVGILAPGLTRLAAEGQARMLGKDSESLRAAELVRRAWPEQSHESLAVVALHRDGGLTAADREYARRLARAFEAAGRPREVLRVLGPDAPAEVAGRLVSRDGTVQLVAVPLAESFVAPATQRVVGWLQGRASRPDLAAPRGLGVGWTGDAVLGADYMGNVQTSLDRAALATVALLLGVLLVVYRSVWLALVPLITIGASLVIARGVLAWMVGAGWEVSPLVELFLVAILFGTGTDFCLFVSWRFGEHFNPDNPAGAMRETLRRSTRALLTSAGTVIVGLALMGTTRFKLFSSTGPSVALGLVLTLAATLTLTPALLVLLARHRPRSFAGLTAKSSGAWDRLGRAAMARPALSWGAALLAMAPLALVSLRTSFVQDILSEVPATTASARSFGLIASKFEPGMVAPLAVVLESDADLRGSEGLALIDDVSRFLAHQRRLVEVRSATQPLGTPAPLARARLSSRLGEVNDGFATLAAGAGELHKGLTEGAVKLRAALWIEGVTGLRLTGQTPGTSAGSGRPNEAMLRDLSRAAEGAGLIADGARRAQREVATILGDPAGRRALDHLLVTAETVRDYPDLRRSFDAYITPDGRRARIDLVQADRVFSAGAMDQVEALRERLDDYLGEVEGMTVKARVGGANAESADIRALTRSDQVQSWFVVPIGVFLVLLVALRDPLACVNLVATMLLTYAFALGATHLVFVVGLGAGGIDWKVPYFLFVLLVAVGVDYNVFLMDRVREETGRLGPRPGIVRAIAQTGGLITSAAAITACSFASFLTSPLGSLRQLGFALVVGITVDALLVRPLLVPCGHWLLGLVRGAQPPGSTSRRLPAPVVGQLVHVAD